MAKGGLMFEASVGGQKFYFTSKETAEATGDWSDGDGDDWKEPDKTAEPDAKPDAKPEADSTDKAADTAKEADPKP
jgi:hypothetical protein